MQTLRIKKQKAGDPPKKNRVERLNPNLLNRPLLNSQPKPNLRKSKRGLAK